jgi:hypothetical protein
MPACAKTCAGQRKINKPGDAGLPPKGEVGRFTESLGGFQAVLGHTSILAPEPVNDRRELMRNRVIKVVAGVTAIAAFALGGAAVAQAVGNTNSGDNNGSAPNSSGVIPQRSDETVLTGDTASKVTAAAQAKVPGATIERVETDADGYAAYEAHMIKADGSRVTVYVNKQFEVVGTDSGSPSR